MGKRVKNVFYTFVATKDGKYSGATKPHTIPLPDIRSLARYLNKWRRRNPDSRIIVAFQSEASGKFIRVVKFLPIEYSAQQWLVGYKERLLANAIEAGYELKWNHGLKPLGGKTKW